MKTNLFGIVLGCPPFSEVCPATLTATKMDVGTKQKFGKRIIKDFFTWTGLVETKLGVIVFRWSVLQMSDNPNHQLSWLLLIKIENLTKELMKNLFWKLWESSDQTLVEFVRPHQNYVGWSRPPTKMGTVTKDSTWCKYGLEIYR